MISSFPLFVCECALRAGCGSLIRQVLAVVEAITMALPTETLVEVARAYDVEIPAATQAPAVLFQRQDDMQTCGYWSFSDRESTMPSRTTPQKTYTNQQATCPSPSTSVAALAAPRAVDIMGAPTHLQQRATIATTLTVLPMFHLRWASCAGTELELPIAETDDIDMS